MVEDRDGLAVEDEESRLIQSTQRPADMHLGHAKDVRQILLAKMVRHLGFPRVADPSQPLMQCTEERRYSWRT